MPRNELIPQIVHDQHIYFMYLRNMGLRGAMMFAGNQFSVIGSGNYYTTPAPANDKDEK